MKEEKKVYVVMKSTGQYEDSIESPYKAFTSKESADKCVEERNGYYDKLEERYDSIGYDVDEKLNQMFLEYLKEVNIELYNEYQEEEKTYKEYMLTHDGDPIGYVNDFNWDAFYDLQEQFKEDDELLNEYADKFGLTDKEREDIEIYKTFNDNFHDGLPYFYVSSRILDLED